MGKRKGRVRHQTKNATGQWETSQLVTNKNVTDQWEERVVGVAGKNQAGTFGLPNNAQADPGRHNQAS